MSGWVWVMLGGAVGAWLRLEVGRRMIGRYPHSYPLPTMLINVLGSFALGSLGAATGFGADDPFWWQLLGSGLLGAFTTFSTFGVEAVTLLGQRQTGRALAYVFGSALLGVSGAWLGAGMVYWMARTDM